MPELWDAYTNDCRLVEGKTLIRGEPIPDGLNHLSCNIIVRHYDGTYLLTLRHPDKFYGGKWELSCGGSALKGENPIQCALRELREETGIVPYTIEQIDRLIEPQCHTIFFNFFARTDCPKDSIKLQEGETVDYKWVRKKKIFGMRKNNCLTGNTILYL